MVSSKYFDENDKKFPKSSNLDIGFLAQIESIIEKEDGEETEDNDSDYRDKDKEKKEISALLNGVLSEETIKVIKDNPKKMEEIIQLLKKKGIAKSEGVDLSKLRTISNNIGRSL